MASGATGFPAAADRPRPRREFKWRFWLAGLAVFNALTSASTADWIRDVQVGAFYNDNLSHSDRNADAREDFGSRVAARFGKFTQLTDNLRLTLTLDADAQAWARYGDFNNLEAGATAGLRYRFGLGTMAPFVRLEGSARYADFRQDLQDGGRYRAAIVLGKRFTARWEVQAAYQFDRAQAQNAVFDQQGHGVSLRTAFDLTDRTQLALEYAFRRGDVISYAVPPRPDVVALARDLREVETFGQPYVAYNLNARTHILAAEINQALNDRLGLRLRYERQATSRGNLDYANNVFLAALQFTF